jgi:predicted TIM-barrel fold metal-dependent hydrolase
VLIIDSQIHLWDGDQAPPHHGQKPYTAEEAVADMDAAGVNAAINAPPMWDADSNRYAIESASRFPDRFATTGWLKLDRPEAPDLVRGWRSQPGMIGFRSRVYRSRLAARSCCLTSSAGPLSIRTSRLSWTTSVLSVRRQPAD